MITSRRMAMVDRNAAALGVPRKQLMESSGNAIADVARDMASEFTRAIDTRIDIVAGRGNNGGDGFVAARFLSAYDVHVSLLGDPETIRTDIARENWEALQAAELPTNVVRDVGELSFEESDLIVDAMLGTGATGALREPEATAAQHINDADAPVLSVDVPSGVDADTGEAAGVAVDPDHVVTFYDAKAGAMGGGPVTIAGIGIPPAAETFVGPGDLLAVERPPESHKGDNGEVLVVGGGPYTGAPALSARAAFRAGADLVRVACPETVAREVQGYEAGIIVRELDGERFAPRHVDRVLDLAAEHDTVVLGPGLGDATPTRDAVARFLRSFEGTAVVDADALQVVPAVDTDATLVCTPHQGELQAMGGDTSDDWRERVLLIEEFLEDLENVTLLVKGRYDVISDGERSRANRTGNAGMTVGGTGDVLAGVTGALAAIMDPHQAASVGAYVTGRAGDIANEDGGPGLVASDLLDVLPAALRDPEEEEGDEVGEGVE